MDYEFNNKKPEALLTGYNTVRGAELKAIYNILDTQGDVPVSAFEERFGRPNTENNDINTSHVDNCLKFLQSVDMIEVSAQDVVSKFNKDVYPKLSFEPRVLYHIRRQTDRQYHLSYIFDVMTKQNSRRMTLELLLEEVNEDDSESFGLQWNTTNLGMWANLSDTLGVISYVNETEENEIITSPTRGLMYELLGWYNQYGDDSERLARALEWIDDEFFAVFYSRPGTPEVAIGVAEVLRNLEEEGALETRSMSDTEDVVNVARRKRGMEAVATFSVNDKPNRASYQYPLDRNKWRGNA